MKGDSHIDFLFTLRVTIRSSVHSYDESTFVQLTKDEVGALRKSEGLQLAATHALKKKDVGDMEEVKRSISGAAMAKE